jgi:hypothetical protein
MQFQAFHPRHATVQQAKHIVKAGAERKLPSICIAIELPWFLVTDILALGQEEKGVQRHGPLGRLDTISYPDAEP